MREQNKIYFDAKKTLDSEAKRDVFTMYVVSGLLMFVSPENVQKVVRQALACTAQEEGLS